VQHIRSVRLSSPSQVIPEGAGPVKRSCALFLLIPGHAGGRAGVKLVSGQRGAGHHNQRTISLIRWWPGGKA